MNAGQHSYRVIKWKFSWFGGREKVIFCTFKVYMELTTIR